MMTSGLAWLNELMTWLARWVPRLVLVTSRHTALVFRPGGTVTQHAPGLLVYWPIVHVLTMVSLQLRTTLVMAQLLGSELVSLAISWRIVDARLAVLSLNDLPATVDNWGAATLSASYSSELSSKDLSELVSVALRARLVPHGIEIVHVHITQRGWGLPIRQMTDWAIHEDRSLEGLLR